MNSKTSFIDIGMLRNDFKSFGWIAAVYLLGLLLSVPLKIVMIHSQQATTGIINIVHISLSNNPYLQIFHFMSPLQLALLLTIPVLTGIFLFRYLQSGEAADMIHALPVRRETLYNSHLAAGIILLFVPLIVTALIAWAVLQGLGIDYVSGREVLIWLGVSLVFNLLLFTCSATVGILCGMSTVQGALTYILLLLPAGLSLLLFDNMRLHIFGFPTDYINTNIEMLSPLLRISSNLPFTGGEIAIYLLCCLAFFLTGGFLYRRRPIENAGNALAFRPLHPVLIYGITFCTMLLLGSYFSSTQNSMSWTYFGYFLGSVLGYLLSIVLINKSLNIFNLQLVRNYLLYSLVVVLLIGGLNFDFFGYEKRIPPLAEVESVFLDGSFHRLKAAKTAHAFYTEESGYTYYSRPVTMVYTDPENIAYIHELHQAIIDIDNRKTEKPQVFPKDRRSTPHRVFCLAYKLENNRTLYRQYEVPVEKYINQIKPINESQEHKRMAYDILSISPLQVDLLQLTANEVNRSIKITDPALIRQAVNALQRDARSQTYEEMTDHRPSWANLTLLLREGKYIHLPWNKSHVYFENWLKAIGEYNTARVMSDDIKYVLVEKNPNHSTPVPGRNRVIEHEPFLMDLEKKGGCLRITDPLQIETLLRSYTYDYDEDGTYRVYFLLKSGSFFSGSLTQKQGDILFAST